MAKLVLVNPHCLINAVNLSNRVRSVSIDYSADEVEDTTGGQNTHTNAPGALKNWTMEIEFAQDFAAANVDATLFPIVGTLVAVEVRPVDAARSATNPGYNGNGIIQRYSPLGQSIGELAVAPVTVRAAGDLARSTV